MYTSIVSGVVSVLLLVGPVAAIDSQEITIPDPGLNAAVRESLQKPAGPLMQEDLLNLTNLTAISRNIADLQGLGAAHNLETLALDDNRLANSSFSNELANLTRLAVLDLSENQFTDLVLPGGLTNLTKLRAEDGQLTQITLPEGLTSLREIHLGFNHLASVALPGDMTNLSVLSLFNNQLTNLVISPSLKNLSELDLDGNQLTSLELPVGLKSLSVLIIGANQLISFTVPMDMTNLTALRLNDNQLSNLILPTGLDHLSLLHLPGNRLRSLSLPSGLTNLSALILTGNQLTNLTLQPDMTQLLQLSISDNPLMTLVLPEPLAATNLANVVDALRTQGVSVFTYPLSAQLLRPRPLVGAFEFGLVGPPGNYSLFGTTNLMTWNLLGTIKNPLGSINNVDVPANSSPQRFYRALLQNGQP